MSQDELKILAFFRDSGNRNFYVQFTDLYSVTIEFNVDLNGNWVSIKEIVWRTADAKKLLVYVVRKLESYGEYTTDTVDFMDNCSQKGFHEYLLATLELMSRLSLMAQNVLHRISYRQIVRKYPHQYFHLLSEDKAVTKLQE